MAEIVISEFMDPTVIEREFVDYDALYDSSLVDRPEELCAALENARALIVRNRTRVDGALLAAAPRLEIIGRLGVGLDNIDLELCSARAIAVRPATSGNERAVAEYVITAVMMLLRGAYFATDLVTSGEWPRMNLIGREATGKLLGLVGYGAIARETARCARALGIHVAAYDPYLNFADSAWHGIERVEVLENLLGRADALSLHVPLTEQTEGLIGNRALAAMKPGAVLVNAARGGIVDEIALAERLKSGRLGGAALDVFESEPLDAERGAIFAGLSNLLLTPHIAGVTVEANRRVSETVARAVIDTLERTG